jgi:hypothetical protein
MIVKAYARVQVVRRFAVLLRAFRCLAYFDEVLQATIFQGVQGERHIRAVPKSLFSQKAPWRKLALFDYLIMSATQTYTTVELNTGTGPVYRKVSTAPPRKPTADEIPIIDLSEIDGSLENRVAIAAKIRKAAENTGFFYVSNHGIEEELIQRSLEKFKTFMAQPLDQKKRASSDKSGMGIGYKGLKSTQINRSEMSGSCDTSLPVVIRS